MTEQWGALRIDVVDDDIIVSLPGTTYSVTYFKRPNSPQLLAKRISDKDDLQGNTDLFRSATMKSVPAW
jgi:hypothetical protein